MYKKMYVFCAISYIHICSYMIYCTYVAIYWKKWTHTVLEAERSRFCTGMLSLAVPQSWYAYVPFSQPKDRQRASSPY